MKRMMTTTLMLALLLSMVSGLQARKPARSQARDVSAEVMEKMAVLNWLEGTWTGETMMSRSGKKLADAVTVTETAHYEMDGLILVIESVGKRGDEVVQQSYTTITWDARRDQYTMMTMTEDGGLIQPQVNANEQGLQWAMKVKNTRAKYTIEKDGNDRKDTSYSATITGEELDWQPVFSMTLEKQ